MKTWIQLLPCLAICFVLIGCDDPEVFRRDRFVQPPPVTLPEAQKVQDNAVESPDGSSATIPTEAN